MSVYLDASATSPLHPAVAARMSEILNSLASGELGNPSSLHTPGVRAHQLLEDARADVAALLGADPEHLIFTSGCTEANNTVVASFSGQPLLASAIEHPSVLEPMKTYAKPFHSIPVDRWGRLDFATFEQLLDQHHPRLVSVMLVNNETGVLQDLPRVISLAHQKGALVHSDLTQALGKLPLSLSPPQSAPRSPRSTKDLSTLDFATFSAHKLGGPVGIGAIYARDRSLLKPLLRGGHQEQGLRAGTSNVLLAAGFDLATRLARENLPQWERVRCLRDALARRILADIPYSSLNTPIHGLVNTSAPHTSPKNTSKTDLDLDLEAAPHILNLSFSAAEGESIQLYLDAAGIAVSTGSACASDSLQPSHVIMATRGDAEIAHGSIRFSLGLETSQSDLDRLMSVLPGIINKLQSISTIKPRKEPL